MDKFLIASFFRGRKNELVSERLGFDRFVMFLDKSETTTVKPHRKYLVRLVHQPEGKRYCFVKVVKKVSALFDELLPKLLAAKWERGQGLDQDARTTINHATFGNIVVKFYNSGGRFPHQYATIILNEHDLNTRCSIEVGKDQADLTALADYIRKQCGPQASFGAVLARQTESRRQY